MPPFWKKKELTEMNESEWESLCDGCGKCCLHKLEDEDTGKVFYTKVACKLLDIKSVKCTNYKERSHLIPDCISLSSKNIKDMHWLPKTCAYRLISEKKDLPVWHPLVSKTKDSVYSSGHSIHDYAVSEQSIDLSTIEANMEKYILSKRLA
jgi:uncharacterized protein